MNVILGSKTKRKILITEKVLKSFLGEDVIVTAFPARSKMPEAPWDKETYDGARNRALDTKANNFDGDLYIGLESGLVERYGHVFEEVWACIIIDNGDEYYGYSSGLKVPDYVLERMKSGNLLHSDVMIQMENEFGLSESDTWGNYSGNLISRNVSLEEALRNAVIQLIEHEKSFYRKKLDA